MERRKFFDLVEFFPKIFPRLFFLPFPHSDPLSFVVWNLFGNARHQEDLEEEGKWEGEWEVEVGGAVGTGEYRSREPLAQAATRRCSCS